MKSLILIIVSTFLSAANAEKFNCVVSVNSQTTSKTKQLWSGLMDLNKKNEGKMMIIDGDNSVINWEEVVKGTSSIEEVKTKLAKYNGKLLFALTKVDNVLKLSQGYVDTTQKNMGPFEALAWSDIKAKRIGLKNIQRELEIDCAK
ncbi:hypothetical protein K2P97_12760 [bacterium]|nr:hypothetical protein [bacterium]